MQPQVFGKYHLLERIGAGGMAEVFRARAYGLEGFEKILVIKRVLGEMAANAEFRELFKDEARIASHLAHVNIVHVYDLGAVDDALYIAMEYVHGLDLARLLSRARRVGLVPVPIALFVATELLKGLFFAHTRRDDEGHPLNIIHCDISPQNVLLSYAGEVKLTDFGISRAAFQAQGTHSVVRGKHAYMSPEQVEGRTLTPRTDLFSVGIVLYEMLAGRRLFKARNRDETLSRVRRADVPSLIAYRPEVSDDLEAVVMKALSRRSEDRFVDGQEMLEALATLMVREGHRASNHELATYVKEVIEAASQPANSRRAAGSAHLLPPSAIVVLSAEATPPPRSLSEPRESVSELLAEWLEKIDEVGGEVWERGENCVLAVWLATDGLRDALSRTTALALDLQRSAHTNGYRLSAGVCPGVVRLRSDTRRPEEGWELAGPFYLSRWMMNLSAHRGRVLVTEVGRRQVTLKTALLGRIPIKGNRYINLHEIG
jgi:serine/threonine protein kinase